MYKIILCFIVAIFGGLQCFAADTTTAAPSVVPVYNFTIKKPNSEDVCLKLQLSIKFEIKYNASYGNTSFTDSVKAPLDDSKTMNYTGVCEDKLNRITITFWNQWSIQMDYKLDGSKSTLDSVELNYFIDTKWFPNATNSSLGYHNASAMSLNKFPTDTGSSYKCSPDTAIALNSDVTIDILNYQAQPFFNKPDKEFDTAIDCVSTGTSKLVPIIVGAALGVTVILVLIAYLIGRKRHRSGYQSV